MNRNETKPNGIFAPKKCREQSTFNESEYLTNE